MDEKDAVRDLLGRWAMTKDGRLIRTQSFIIISEFGVDTKSFAGYDLARESTVVKVNNLKFLKYEESERLDRLISIGKEAEEFFLQLNTKYGIR